MPELELVRLEFLLLAVETIGVLVLDSLDKFNSRIIESSAHAFLDLPRFIFLWCGPRAFWFGSTKLERQTNLVMLHIGKSNVGPHIRVEHIFDLRFFNFDLFFHFFILILVFSCHPTILRFLHREFFHTLRSFAFCIVSFFTPFFTLGNIFKFFFLFGCSGLMFGISTESWPEFADVS